MLEPSRRFSRHRNARSVSKGDFWGEAGVLRRRSGRMESRSQGCGGHVPPQDSDGRGAIPPRSQDRGAHAASRDLRILRTLAPLLAQHGPPSPHGGHPAIAVSPRDSASGIDATWEATMLFKIALALLFVWGLGIAGVYAVGQIVHVLLLVGLMLLLLSFAKAHEAAAHRPAAVRADQRGSAVRADWKRDLLRAGRAVARQAPSSPWWKCRVAPRRARRPAIKARGGRISGIFDRRATPSAGWIARRMQRDFHHGLLGIVLFSYGARLAGARLPDGLMLSDVVVVGIAAAIGFTVALFFATAAFPAAPCWPRRRWAPFSVSAQRPWRCLRHDSSGRPA